MTSTAPLTAGRTESQSAGERQGGLQCSREGLNSQGQVQPGSFLEQQSLGCRCSPLSPRLWVWVTLANAPQFPAEWG